MSASLYPWAHELDVMRGLDVDGLKPLERAALALAAGTLRDAMLREAGDRVIAQRDSAEAERIALGFAEIRDAAVSGNVRAGLD